MRMVSIPSGRMITADHGSIGADGISSPPVSGFSNPGRQYWQFDTSLSK